MPRTFEDRLYRAYSKDRAEGISHVQIVKDGCYGSEVDAFGRRYDADQAAYVDAMIRERRDYPAAPNSHLTTWGQRYRGGQ